MELIFEKLNGLFVHGLLSGMITIVLCIILFSFLNRVLNQFIDKHSFQQKKVIKSVKKIIILTLCIVIIASQFTALTPFLNTLLASGGILAVVIGLASQEAASSIVSGAMILFSKPFQIGDTIILKEQNLRGTVKDIRMNHTIIETLEKNLIMIPNTQMNKAIIENLTYSDEYKIGYVYIDISYESDIEKAMDIMRQVVVSHPLYYDLNDDSELIHCMDFKDSGISLRAKIPTRTIADNFQMCSDCRIQIKHQFDEQGISIPYPHIQLIQ